MTFQTAVFFGFSTILIAAALRVITARNPVHAALFLVLSFVTASGLWMLLEAEFLAITLVLVYVGAVMVLFLFVVMMLDINLDRLREGYWDYLVPALVVAGRHDSVATPAVVARMAERLHDARYLELDAGHLLPYEAPRAFAAAVRAFLADRIAVT